MKKQHFVFGLVLLVCILGTSLVTRWFVLADLRPDCAGAADFYRHSDKLIDFVKSHNLADGEQMKGDTLPERLKSTGITSVYRNGRFVYFVMPHKSILADDGTREFIWQLDSNGGSVEEILRTTKRNTFHIQHLSSAPGWYYWLHN